MTRRIRKTKGPHPNWNMFTDEMVNAFMAKIEDTRKAALFREMSSSEQITAMMSGLVGAIIWVMYKAQLDDRNWDALHEMLEMGRRHLKAGGQPVNWHLP